MSLTRLQMEIYQFCSTHDFVPRSVIEDFRQRFEKQEPNNASSLSFALSEFLDDTCPNCKAVGAFKFHFLGQLKHKPGCDWSWYVNPGTYSATQFGKVFRAGATMGGGMMDDAHKKGESGGCIYAIFGFIFGALFRLVFAILMIPIQAIVSLTQRKPETSQSGND